MLAEHGANKCGGWDLGLSAAELPGSNWRGTPDQKAEAKSVLRGAASSARSPKVSSVRYVPGDQQEGPLPPRCFSGRRWRRKGDPSVEMLPAREQGLWARRKAEKVYLVQNKKKRERFEEHCCKSIIKPRRRHFLSYLGGDTECSL